MSIATALVQARKAEPELAARAIALALGRAGMRHADNALLFLSAEFMPFLQEALDQAAAAAGTEHIFGCTTVGVMTEDDWVIDGPCAAAMVFGPGSGLSLVRKKGELFTLAAPNAINTLWLDRPEACHGGVSGDFTGRGPYTVWSEGRLQDSGRVEARWKNAQALWQLSFGLELLTPVLTVTGADGLDLLAVDGEAAALPLWHALRDEDATDQLPLVYAVLDQGEPIPVLSVHLHNGRVTLARALPLGTRLRWAMRTAAAAVEEIEQALDNSAALQGDPPRYAVMVASAGRGPSLHNGRDAEWEALCSRWPGLPLIGFYGNGEITRFAGSNRVLTTSTLLGFFR